MLARMLPRADYAGGVSGQAHLLASELQRRGHDVTVFALNAAPDGSPYRSRVVGDFRGAHGRRGSIYAFPWWASKLPFDAFDLVHSHGDDHFLRTRRPVVRTFYGTSLAESRVAGSIRHRAHHLSMVLPERISERRATIRVAISTATLASLSRPAEMIPCAFDPSIFFQAGAKSEAPSVLYVGDFSTRKRAELVLVAFRDVVRPAMPTAELWLVTDTAAQGDGIRWFGRLPVERLADLYRQAWVFCLPSRYEGFGVPYIEAMACGTPVVATPNGGSDDVLGGGGGRLVCESALGETLRQLLADGVTRGRLAEDACRNALQYRVDRIADRYVTVYEQAVAQS